MRCRPLPKNNSKGSTPDRVSFDKGYIKPKDNKSKIISKYSRLKITEIEEKEENLIPFDYIEDCQVERSEFIIDEFDDSCPEYLKIDKVVCLRLPLYKNILLYVLNICTLFIFNLLVTWLPEIYLYIYEKSDLTDCGYLGIFGKDKSFTIAPLNEVTLPNLSLSHLRKLLVKIPNDEKNKYFEYKLYKYLYNPEKAKFVPLKIVLAASHKSVHQNFRSGLNNKEVEYQSKLFGVCDYEFKTDSIFQLLVKEITDPFYIFQLISITFWIFHDYMNYAIVIIISTSISLFISIFETRDNLKNIQEMAKYSVEVRVHRQVNSEKKIIAIDSRELVPGDIFELPETGWWVPCDCVLLDGAVVVNESVLTGEIVPLVKQSIGNGNEHFNKEERRHILYAGTKIVQKRSNPLCFILATGFNTERGNLIRSTMFTKDPFRLKKESIMYIKVMACISLIGFIVTLPFMITIDLPTSHIVDRVLDTITTTVPPSLPACIGICISYGVHRIKKKGILCINRERITRVGKIQIVCFDKTGTLTEDDLNIFGFKTTCWHQGSFYLDNFIPNLEALQQESYNNYKLKKISKTQELKISFIELMATCHSLTKVGDDLLGDSIDVQMFGNSGWVLKEDDNTGSLVYNNVIPKQEVDLEEKMRNNSKDDINVLKSHYELAIIRRFEFSSMLQRMTVIVKNNNEEHFKVFCKGSPEKIRDLCNPDTIPINIEDGIKKYTTKGYRVLACAMKKVKMSYIQSQQITRETLESNMIFLGIIIVENKLKPDTRESIEILRNKSDLKLLMATGDHILTAISVAKESHLIDRDKHVVECEIMQNNLFTKINWNPAGLDLYDENASNNRENNEESLRESVASLPCEEGVFRLSNPSCGSFTEFTHQRNFSVNKNLFFSHLDTLDYDTQNHFNEIKKHKDVIIAISGSSFEKIKKLRDKYLEKREKKFYIYFEIFKYILENCYLYARMTPDHKTMLIECLQKMRKKVCMVGDGANDCGALKAADVGVSLSIEEASIASPFTSNISNISCLPNLIIEGKATLTTCMQLLKYMMLYSIIQFVAVSILLFSNTYLSDNQYLIADLFIIFPLALLLAR
jgi:cation-transporting ATPase 13A2